MADLKATLRQDAASLQQFVNTIADHCERRNSAAAYLQSSERFFSYIVKLAASTRSFLTQSLESRTDAKDLLDLRSDISVLRAGWRFLHGFVKPVLDADTLRLPCSLVLGLTSRFREIPQFSDTEFVIYHTDEFNYFNVKLSVLKPGADRIAGLVSGPSFPDKLGLIGIPYSQASSMFMNCLIPHEMGHHVFGQLALSLKFKAQLEQELIARFGVSLSAEARLQIVERLAFWTEEIFCDLFAVRLVGFCFSLAFVELFDVSTVLEENSVYSPARATGKTEFLQYPPDLFRLRQQVAVLQQDKWWLNLQKIDSHYIRTFEAATALRDQDFGFLELRNYFTNIDPAVVLSAFYGVIPTIFSELDKITSGLRLGTDGWESTDKGIALYLRNGIVPSSIRLEASGANTIHPEPVSLLNASYKFYLEGLDDLIANIEGAEVINVGDRTKWAKKVELWTAKAIEDVMLMTGRVS